MKRCLGKCQLVKKKLKKNNAVYLTRSTAFILCKYISTYQEWFLLKLVSKEWRASISSVHNMKNLRLTHIPKYEIPHNFVHQIQHLDIYHDKSDTPRFISRLNSLPNVEFLKINASKSNLGLMRHYGYSFEHNFIEYTSVIGKNVKKLKLANQIISIDFQGNNLEELYFENVEYYPQNQNFEQCLENLQTLSLKNSYISRYFYMIFSKIKKWEFECSSIFYFDPNYFGDCNESIFIRAPFEKLPNIREIVRNCPKLKYLHITCLISQREYSRVQIEINLMKKFRNIITLYQISHRLHISCTCDYKINNI